MLSLTSKIKKDYPHTAGARKYANAVLSGKIPACKWVQLACKRQEEDIQKEGLLTDEEIKFLKMSEMGD
jgi:hypothetical protein